MQTSDPWFTLSNADTVRTQRKGFLVFSRQSIENIGCPPGIRTPIGCSRGSCPTIERGGSAEATAGRNRLAVSILRAERTAVNPGWPAKAEWSETGNAVGAAGLRAMRLGPVDPSVGGDGFEHRGHLLQA
jgi:hypothetical protein